MGYLGTKPANAALTSEQIGDGVITTADLANGAVSPAKLSTGAPSWDTSSNVGIGTSSPAAKLHIEGNSGITTQIIKSTASVASRINFQTTADSNGFFNYDSGSFIWFNNSGGSATERMRITSGGDVCIGSTAFTWIPTQTGYQFKTPSTPWFVITGNNATADNSFGPSVYNLNATYNGTRFFVRVDGGVANYSANNQNLSDERVKNNIELSGGYLDKICAIPVKLFNYKDEPEGTQKSLGVIAQDVEAVAPELINATDGFGVEDTGDEPLKTVYQTDLQYALMKCIQEQQAIITELKTRIEALEQA